MIKRIHITFITLVICIMTNAQSAMSGIDDMIKAGLYWQKTSESAKQAAENHDFKLSITLVKDALNYFEENHIGGRFPSLALYDLINYYEQNEDYKEAGENSLKLRDRAVNMVKSNMSNPIVYGLTLGDTDEYLDVEGVLSLQLYDNVIKHFATKFGGDITIQYLLESLYYNKSIRLRANNNFAYFAYETDDTEAKEYLTRIYETRDSLVAWQKIGQETFYDSRKGWNSEDGDRYTQHINDYKTRLIERYKAYPNFDMQFFHSWKDVQSKLQSTDIAIEFFKAQDSDKQINYYGAICLKSNYEVPIMVKLFDEDKLDALDAQSVHKLHSLVWKPLESQLEGVSNVYFSLDDKLHAYPVESFIDSTGTSMDERFSMFRLSSTSELVKAKKAEHPINAILFGGLKYMPNQPFENTKEIDSHIKGKRGGLDEISQETLEEVLQIDSILKKKNFFSKCYIGDSGTEAAFKSLNNSDVSLLHISTHGFFNPARLFVDKSPIYLSDSIMCSSGLLMSGASVAWESNEIIKGKEDDVLTSHEIAKLRFPNLDLVVLSACETGLGEIRGTEGVYGLQRGFKQAGAKSILMTLWEVEDIPTKLFMVEFYKNYLSGISKVESLSKAKDFLKNYKDKSGSFCYVAPEYWAAFILLDSLN